MTKPTNDRLPTKDDGDHQGYVEKYSGGEWILYYWHRIIPGDWWQPTNRPTDPPPEPKERQFADGATYAKPGMWIDQDFRLWTGPDHRDSNLHFAICEGFDNQCPPQPIWVMRASELPEGCTRLLMSQAEVDGTDFTPDPPPEPAKDCRDQFKNGWATGSMMCEKCGKVFSDVRFRFSCHDKVDGEWPKCCGRLAKYCTDWLPETDPPPEPPSEPVIADNNEKEVKNEASQLDGDRSGPSGKQTLYDAVGAWLEVWDHQGPQLELNERIGDVRAAYEACGGVDPEDVIESKHMLATEYCKARNRAQLERDAAIKRAEQAEADCEHTSRILEETTTRLKAAEAKLAVIMQMKFQCHFCGAGMEGKSVFANIVTDPGEGYEWAPIGMGGGDDSEYPGHYRRRIKPDSKEVGDSTQMTEDTPLKQATESDPKICSGSESSSEGPGSRREYFSVWHDGIFFAEYRSRHAAEQCVLMHPDSDKCEIGHMQQRLPTDIDQAKVRQVREEMRDGLRRKEIPFWKVMGWIQLLTPEGE